MTKITVPTIATEAKPGSGLRTSSLPSKAASPNFQQVSVHQLDLSLGLDRGSSSVLVHAGGHYSKAAKAAVLPSKGGASAQSAHQAPVRLPDMGPEDLSPTLSDLWSQLDLQHSSGVSPSKAQPDCSASSPLQASVHQQESSSKAGISRLADLRSRLELSLVQKSMSPMSVASPSSPGSPSSATQHERPRLCPSVAPTPRERSASKQILYGSFLVRPAQILVPSANTANDFARIRNGGKALQPRSPLRDTNHGILHIASAPALLSGTSAASNSDLIEASGPVPKTPRSTRGLVRRVSKVSCSMPLVDPASMSLRKHRGGRGDPPSQSNAEAGRGGSNVPSPTASETGKPKKSSSTKRVSFAEHGNCTSRLQALQSDGIPSPALKRSCKLMESLHDLRRVNTEDHIVVVAPGIETAGSFSAEEKAAAMLHTTLGELFDSEASLRALEEQLRGAHDDVAELGGVRHATALISARTLAVVHRKAELLKVVEARTAALEAAHARREEFVPQLMKGDLKEPPADLVGMRKFIAEHSHKSASGSPVDADKSDFAAFASSFKLPSRHHQFERMRALAEEVSMWWAETALRIAEEGATYEQIRRMFAVAIGAGAKEDHPYILRATRILNDRLADKVLKDAQERQQRDTEAFERSDVPQVGPASRAADAIEQALLQAIAEGVPEHDPRLTKTKEICKMLREADGQRKRLAARQKRLDGQHRS